MEGGGVSWIGINLPQPTPSDQRVTQFVLLDREMQ